MVWFEEINLICVKFKVQTEVTVAWHLSKQKQSHTLKTLLLSSNPLVVPANSLVEPCCCVDTCALPPGRWIPCTVLHTWRAAMRSCRVVASTPLIDWMWVPDKIISCLVPFEFMNKEDKRRWNRGVKVKHGLEQSPGPTSIFIEKNLPSDLTVKLYKYGPKQLLLQAEYETSKT